MARRAEGGGAAGREVEVSNGSVVAVPRLRSHVCLCVFACRRVLLLARVPSHPRSGTTPSPRSEPSCPHALGRTRPLRDVRPSTRFFYSLLSRKFAPQAFPWFPDRNAGLRGVKVLLDQLMLALRAGTPARVI